MATTPTVTGEIAHQPPARQPYDSRDAAVVGAAVAAAAVFAAAANFLGLPRLQPLVGLIVIMTIAYLFSTNRRAIDRRTVAWGLGLQVLFALIVLKTAIGQQVFKYRRDGTLLMTLGRAGESGEGADAFNGPCDVAVAENGDIFVADGHWNARIVKFSKDGRFIKTWGRKGTGPGEFDVPHTLVIDKRGRVLVGDRTNQRVQLFDQDGRFLDQWTHLGSPSGMFIAPDDTLFVVDYNDRKGIFIASAESGVLRQKLDDAVAELVAVGADGSIYVGETVPGETLTGLAGGNLVRKFTRQP